MFRTVESQLSHQAVTAELKAEFQQYDFERVAGNIRDVLGDFEFARLGGEEFGVYLWDITPDEVQRRMQLLLATVREAPEAHPLTISIGLRRLDAGDSLNQALYDSKHNGRNRCTYAP